MSDHFYFILDTEIFLVGSCINLEGWDGAGDGREVQKGGDIWIPVPDSC